MFDRDRTNYSFKTVRGARIAGPFDFEVELKNIILVVLQDFEFSHTLGHSRRFDAPPATSDLLPTADITRQGPPLPKSAKGRHPRLELGRIAKPDD
jgi:hypothetical protein